VPDPRIESQRRLIELHGEIPSPMNPPSGCHFHTRCPIAQVPGICADQEPPLEEKAPGRFAACHFSEKVRTELTALPGGA
jgi:oligopeptide transport system ATP-binding protein